MATFLRHSSASIQDVNIKTPDLYNNVGKYPFIFTGGCEGGEFGNGLSFCEKWIAEPSKGAIGCLASSHLTYIAIISSYTDSLYANVFNKMIGERMGDIVKTTFGQYLPPSGSQTPNSQAFRNTIRQMNLQGDPTLRLYMPPTISSIAEIEKSSENLVLFPNPVSSSASLNLSLLENGTTQGTIFVYDKLGKICKMQEILREKGNTNSILLSDLPTGVYILTLQTRGKVFVKRFIVE